MREPLLQNTLTAKRTSIKRWELLLMIPLLVGTILLCVFSWEWKNSLRVLRVIVEGPRVMTAQQILSLANISTKAPLYGIDLQGSRKRLLAQPFLQSVSFHRQFPGVVRIRVTERTPIASLNIGQLRYVDTYGVILPYVSSQIKLDLPMINGIEGMQKIQLGDRSTNSEMTTAIEILQMAQAIDSSMLHFISEVNMNNGKDIMLTSTDVGVPIYLGRGDIEKKLLTLQSFWNGFVKDHGAEKLQYIDLRYEDQVVVRWVNEHKQQTQAAL